MYNILISAAAAVAVLLILVFVLKLAWWGSLIVGLIVFALIFVLFSRITMKKVMASIETAGRDLQAQPPRFEKAIRELKDEQLVREQPQAPADTKAARTP